MKNFLSQIYPKFDNILILVTFSKNIREILNLNNYS